MAWAFTRLRLQGVWRYLNNVDEVLVHVFILCVFKQITIINLKQNDYEKTITITCDDVVIDS